LLLLLYHVHIHLEVEHASCYTRKGGGCRGKDLSLSSVEGLVKWVYTKLGNTLILRPC